MWNIPKAWEAEWEKFTPIVWIKVSIWNSKEFNKYEDRYLKKPDGKMAETLWV